MKKAIRDLFSTFDLFEKSWPGNKSNIGQKIFVKEEKWIIRGHIIVVLIMKEQEGSSSNARAAWARRERGCQ